MNKLINMHPVNLKYNRRLCSLYTGPKGSSLNRLYLIKPLASYTNCDIEKNNIFVSARLHRDSGVVYCWVNNVNHKCYVGSSINFNMRLYKYYSVKHIHNSKSAISSALSKYGYSNFSLHILEYCYKDESIKKEQHYIELLKPEYNIFKKAGSSLGFKHSEKTLNLFREERKVSDTTKKNLSWAAKKRILTPEEKKKISIYRLGKRLPLETCNKISASTSES